MIINTPVYKLVKKYRGDVFWSSWLQFDEYFVQSIISNISDQKVIKPYFLRKFAAKKWSLTLIRTPAILLVILEVLQL
ncbi:MAG: hypothetical protein P8046_15740, partial [Anaerolineales bacterium]